MLSFGLPPVSLGQTPQRVLEILWLAGVAAGAIIVAAVVLLIVQRRAKQMRESGLESPFTLDGLRQMHEHGHLTDKEYQRARRKLLAQLTGRPEQSFGDEAISDAGDDEEVFGPELLAPSPHPDPPTSDKSDPEPTSGEPPAPRRDTMDHDQPETN